jgi:hypothetical protein
MTPAADMDDWYPNDMDESDGGDGEGDAKRAKLGSSSDDDAGGSDSVSELADQRRAELAKQMAQAEQAVQERREQREREQREREQQAQQQREQREQQERACKYLAWAKEHRGKHLAYAVTRRSDQTEEPLIDCRGIFEHR